MTMNLTWAMMNVLPDKENDEWEPMDNQDDAGVGQW